MTDFKRFSRHTAVYTVGNFVYRGASFLLVPLYVHALSPAAYGSLELITTTILIIQSVLASGIAHSAMRFYFDYDDKKKQNTVITTALIGSFVFAGVGVLLCVAAAPVLSKLVFHTVDYTLAFRLASVSIVLEISREINLAFVRAKERPGMFIVISVVQLVTQVCASLFLVIHLQLGVVGILAANLTATFCVWAVLTASTLRECGWHFNPGLLMPIVRYGYPLMLSGLSASIFQSLDRYFLNGYVSLPALGAYALAMRIANVIPVLVITPFTNSYGPYRLAIMRDENAGQMYARIARYYTIVGGFVLVAISTLSREVVTVFASAEYLPAADIVPFLLIPAAVAGLNYCFQTAIYIQKNTRQLFYIALISGLVNLTGLIVLVPRLGLLGAALSAILACAYTLTHTYIVAQKLLFIPYEWGKLARISAIAAVLIVCASPLRIDNLWQAVALKAALAATYPFLVFLVGGIEWSEFRGGLRRPRAAPVVKPQARSAVS